MTTVQQTRAIHALSRTIGLTDDDYRGILRQQFRAASSKDLSEAQAGRLIEFLKEQAGQKMGQSVPPGRKASTTASGRYAAVLQALWIAAYNLGVVRTRDDAAMLKFVARQSGLEHTRFLNDPADARKAIEGLKAWIGRESGIDWAGIDRNDPFAAKRVVAQAIAARLVKEGAFKPFLKGDSGWPVDFERYGYTTGLPASFSSYDNQQWDKLNNRLGNWLRTALAQSKRKAA